MHVSRRVEFIEVVSRSRRPRDRYRSRCRPTPVDSTHFLFRVIGVFRGSLSCDARNIVQPLASRLRLVRSKCAQRISSDLRFLEFASDVTVRQVRGRLGRTRRTDG